eukprot:gene27890-34458_t
MPKSGPKPTGSGSKANRAERRGKRFGTGGGNQTESKAVKAKKAGISKPKSKPGRKFRETKPNVKPEKTKAAPKSKAEPEIDFNSLDDKTKKKLIDAKRKTDRKPLHPLIQELSAEWEVYKARTTSATEKTKIIAILADKSKGKVAALGNDHKASRVLQAVLKFGSSAHKQKLLEELQLRRAGSPAGAATTKQARRDILPLSKSTYGNFLIRKLLESTPPADLPKLLAAFRGKITQLARHPCGSAVLDVAYTLANPVEKAAMLAEFYGPEFALDAQTKAVVAATKGEKNPNALARGMQFKDALAGAPPGKRKSVVHNSVRSIVPIVEKGLIGPEYVHRVLAELVNEVPKAVMTELLENLCDTALLRMLHTMEGITVGAAMVRHGAAKDRKKIARALKGNVMK